MLQGNLVCDLGIVMYQCSVMMCGTFARRTHSVTFAQSKKNEIDDWRAVLGATHWMVLERQEQYFHILRSLGYWDKAEDGTLKDLGPKSPPDDLRALRAQSNLAIACLDQRKTDDAESLMKEVLQRNENYSVSDQMTRLVHRYFLASVYTAQEKFMKAINLRRKSTRKYWRPSARIIYKH